MIGTETGPSLPRPHTLRICKRAHAQTHPHLRGITRPAEAGWTKPRAPLPRTFVLHAWRSSALWLARESVGLCVRKPAFNQIRCSS